MGRSRRIVFMGTPAFAVPSLKALIEAGHEILAAVTQPDKPKGRGLNPMPSPVKETALSHNIPVFEPGKVKDPEFIERLKGLKPEFIAVVAYGKILPEAILEIPPKGCINVHASLLPKYRGAAPINWAIINGDKETGVSTMYMDKGMDTGAVLLEERIPIEENDTAVDLAKKLSISGATLLTETIDLLAEDKLKPKPQEGDKATYAPILKKENGKIDWKKSAVEIRNLLRGLYPWPGIYTYWNGRLLKIHSGTVEDFKPDNLPPGTVVKSGDGRIKVACGSGCFDIIELQPENKKKMAAADFLKGYRLSEGERLG